MSLSLLETSAARGRHAAKSVSCVCRLCPVGLVKINSEIRFLALISKSAVTLLHHLGQFGSVYLVVKCVPYYLLDLL